EAKTGIGVKVGAVGAVRNDVVVNATHADEDKGRYDRITGKQVHQVKAEAVLVEISRILLPGFNVARENLRFPVEAPGYLMAIAEGEAGPVLGAFAAIVVREEEVRQNIHIGRHIVVGDGNQF